MVRAATHDHTRAWQTLKHGKECSILIHYADDTAILAENADDLNRALRVYELYCNTWKLTINSSNSSVLIYFQEVEYHITNSI